MTSTGMKPVLHVEVLLKESSTRLSRTDLVREEVQDWLLRSFKNLKINQRLTNYDTLEHGAHIDNIQVVDSTGVSSEESDYHRISDIDLDVQAFELHAENIASSQNSFAIVDDDQDESLPQMQVKHLPHKGLNGVWESLVFEEPIPSRLLRYITRMMALAKHPRLDPNLMNWNRLVLLHGPPGSGKSTLCRALAQKLTIRLGHLFTDGRLVEINTHSVLSKWFGESGKQVNKLFDAIHRLADEETTLVCVLIDEVETLAGSRELASAGNECADAMRATNQLLTALDRLRTRSNVIVFCTTNIISIMDNAFLDRVDIKQLLPNPPPQATYEILRSCLNELIRSEIIGPAVYTYDVSDGSSQVSSPTRPKQYLQWQSVDGLLPPFAEMTVLLWDRHDSPGRMLWDVAQQCQGLSGRTLRRLPFLALALFTYADPCPFAVALNALEQAIREEAKSCTVA